MYKTVVMVIAIVAFGCGGFWLFTLLHRLQHPSLRVALVRMVAIVVSFLSFFSFTSFRSAERPWPGSGIPPDWSAGVMDHGEYYRWWTIADNPTLYVLSILGLLVSCPFVLMTILDAIGARTDGKI